MRLERRLHTDDVVSHVGRCRLSCRRNPCLHVVCVVSHVEKATQKDLSCVVFHEETQEKLHPNVVVVVVVREEKVHRRHPR